MYIPFGAFIGRWWVFELKNLDGSVAKTSISLLIAYNARVAVGRDVAMVTVHNDLRPSTYVRPGRHIKYPETDGPGPARVGST